jgi:hypothetical protein
MNTLTRTGARIPPPPRPTIAVEVDERSARRSLLDQIARLETELSQLFCSAYPRTGFEWSVASRGGPRILSLGELEKLRDDLAERLTETRRTLNDRTYVEEKYRRLIEDMQLEPERHRWIRVSNEDIGEPGCKHWHVRPRLGLLGMLMGWWRVLISSGCPLPARVAPASTFRSSGAGPPSPPTSRSRARCSGPMIPRAATTSSSSAGCRSPSCSSP